MLFRHRPLDRFPSRIAGMLVLTASTAGLLHLNTAGASADSMPGGALGFYVGRLMLQTFGIIGSNVIVVVLGIVGILLATEFLFFRAFKALPILWVLLLRATSALYHGLRKMAIQYMEHEKDRRQRYKKTAKRLLKEEGPIKRGRGNLPGSGAIDEAEEEDDDLSRIRILPSPRDTKDAGGIPVEETLVEPEKLASVEAETQPVAAGRETPKKRRMPRRRTQPEEELPPDYEYPKRYKKPSLDILDRPTPHLAGEGLNDQLRQTSLVLERALETHGIEARVTGCHTRADDHALRIGAGPRASRSANSTRWPTTWPWRSRPTVYASKRRSRARDASASKCPTSSANPWCCASCSNRGRSNTTRAT